MVTSFLTSSAPAPLDVAEIMIQSCYSFSRSLFPSREKNQDNFTGGSKWGKCCWKKGNEAWNWLEWYCLGISRQERSQWPWQGAHMSPQQEDREQGGLNWLLFSCVTSQKPLRAALAGAGAGETIGIGFRLLNLVLKLEVWLAPANQVWAGLGNVCCPFFAGIQEKHAIRSLF